MRDNIRDKFITILFCVIIGAFLVVGSYRLVNPVKTSEAERRPLAQLPSNVTWESIIDRSAIEKTESALTDQFPMREFFRTLKAEFKIHVLGAKENNRIAVEDGYYAKIESAFDDRLTDYSIGRLVYIYEKYLKDNGGEKFVSLIPDKNYFFARDYGYPGPDYDNLRDKVQAALPGMTYIDIFDTLELSDYYRTDTHWSQPELAETVQRLIMMMNPELVASSEAHVTEYTEHRLEGFDGVYKGQISLITKPDTLVYLTDPVIDGCTVYDYETGKTSGIYNPELFERADQYDVFLAGTRALLRIDNPNAGADKELILFRDSFGSSIAPLMVDGYKSIYLVDIRYISPDYLGEFIDFSGKDVLFLYSAMILNQKAFK
ncbi:MAG: DHHW family protein [Eubacteriales bacterium]|nr:DHHW family protein [Eubacteriales bacterium]